MQRVPSADNADRPPRSRVGVLATPRRRAFAACAIVVLLLHGGLVGGIGGIDIGRAPERGGGAPVSVRTIAAAERPAADSAVAVSEASLVETLPTESVVKPAEARRPRKPTIVVVEDETVSETASARIVSVAPPSVTDPMARPSETSASAEPAVAETGSILPSIPVASTEAIPAAGDLPSLLLPGEGPPPVYRTRLPPSATLRYQVRRGFLRGTGEIRWQASGDNYRLTLEARIAGLTLLMQTSEGAIDANGLAPVRFLDRRARRPAQAANFRRDTDRITFSGPAVEWPLLPGSQDRLSWMIQLAGIAAAEPGLLVEGGRISMVVVGARGEAAVWTLRCAGREDVETAWGTVHAVRLVREGQSAYDTHAEIWLDPARDHLPARATTRNGAGAAEYDLLLERVEPPS